MNEGKMLKLCEIVKGTEKKYGKIIYYFIHFH